MAAAASGTAAVEAEAARMGRVVPILRELISIPSVNPEQCAKGDPNAGEGRVAARLRELFEEAGADEAVLDEAGTEPGRPNVYGVWRAADPEAGWVGVDVHTDTVTVAGMAPLPPFSAALDAEGRLHGRGSCDTKATLAALLGVFFARGARAGAPPAGLQHNLVVAGTVGEETGRLGARAFKAWLLRRGVRVRELLVAEPTRCRAVYGHKGRVALCIHLRGKACHSSRPELGANAVVAGAAVISAVDALNSQLRGKVGPLGAPTATPTIVAGGSGANTVPADCSITVDRRVVHGEDPAAVAAGLVETARAAVAASSQPGVGVDSEIGSSGPSFMQDPGVPFVHRLTEWGGAGPPEVVTFGTNANVPYQPEVADHVVVFGPGDIAQAHQADEWITLEQLRRSQGVLARWLFGDEDGAPVCRPCGAQSSL